MKAKNPFSDAAAEGIGAAAIREIEWQLQVQAWNAHVEACRAIMRNAVMTRLELAAEAARRRWPKVAYTAEAISAHADEVIRDFLRWGVV